MNTELIEELFAAIVAKPPLQRQDFIVAANYPQVVKDAAIRLVNAYESKSLLLNDDLLSDIARIDPDFFRLNRHVSDFALKPGERVKDYIIESVIGEGGMSVVYRAIQKHPIKRRVALKLIRPSLLTPKTMIRFLREQQALALVGHSNIAALYEVGTTPAGHPFAAMEYVNGMPINLFCEKYQMDCRQRTILFLKACEGLMHAHRHGIIHRDIKPDNILVCVRDRQPVAKLIDFGIAKFDRDDLDNNQTMTQVGQVLGSPRYMSPEQFEGKTAGPQTDLFSASLVLFELLARTPFRNSDTTEGLMIEARAPEPELLSRRINETIRNKGATSFRDDSIDDLMKFVKRDLDWILFKALARNPEQRYPSMERFIQDLRATLRNQPVSVTPPSTLDRAKRFAVRNRIWIGSVAALVLVLASSYWFANWRNSASELTAALRANSASEVQAQAANNLIMSLMASDKYELRTEQFEYKLIPVYRMQYERIKANGGPSTRQDRAIYGILAVLYAVSGNFDQADELLLQAADDAQRTELKKVREKICSQYAESAKKKLRTLESSKHGFEMAKQQLILGRCYVVLNMLDEATSLLKDSIEFFDSHKPGCYESLVARNTLIMIFEKGNESKEKLDLLLETLKLFENNRKVLETQLGQSAFGYVVDSLAEVDPIKYGGLRDTWHK